MGAEHLNPLSRFMNANPGHSHMPRAFKAVGWGMGWDSWFHCQCEWWEMRYVDEETTKSFRGLRVGARFCCPQLLAPFFALGLQVRGCTGGKSWASRDCVGVTEHSLASCHIWSTWFFSFLYFFQESNKNELQLKKHKPRGSSILSARCSTVFYFWSSTPWHWVHFWGLFWVDCIQRNHIPVEGKNWIFKLMTHLYQNCNFVILMYHLTYM